MLDSPPHSSSRGEKVDRLAGYRARPMLFSVEFLLFSLPTSSRNYWTRGGAPSYPRRFLEYFRTPSERGLNRLVDSRTHREEKPCRNPDLIKTLMECATLAVDQCL